MHRLCSLTLLCNWHNRSNGAFLCNVLMLIMLFLRVWNSTLSQRIGYFSLRINLFLHIFVCILYWHISVPPYLQHENIVIFTACEYFSHCVHIPCICLLLTCIIFVHFCIVYISWICHQYLCALPPVHVLQGMYMSFLQLCFQCL